MAAHAINISQIDNHMVLGNADAFPDQDTHECASCGDDISDVDNQEVVTISIMLPRPHGTFPRFRQEYFCNEACRSSALYAAASTKGKATLLQYAAALHLIASTDLADYAPLDRFELDEFHVKPNPSSVVSMADFREMAMALSAELCPDSALWADQAVTLADNLATATGKVA